jgi:hypothetical protein
MENFNLKKYLAENRLNENPNNKSLGYSLFYKGIPASAYGDVNDSWYITISRHNGFTMGTLNKYMGTEEEKTNTLQGLSNTQNPVRVVGPSPQKYEDFSVDEIIGNLEIKEVTLNY